MNLYGWSKHLFDLAARRPPASRRADAAAMGRPEVLQRVRPERVPQGRDDEPRRQARSTKRQGRQAGHDCSSRIATASPTASRSATSSMSTTRSLWFAGCSISPNVSGIFNVGTGEARSFRDLIAGDVRRARPGTRHRIRRDAAFDPRRSISISRRAEVDNLRRAGYNAGFTPLEAAVTDYVTGYPRPPGPLPVRATGEASEVHVRSSTRRLKLVRRQTVLCVGDVMLDDFVYGEVTRISPEAPVPVIAVSSSELVSRRRRQCGAQCRRARRALRSSSVVIGDDEAGRTLELRARGRSAIETVLVVDAVAADHPQGALRLGASLHASAARRLGAGQGGRFRGEVEQAVIDARARRSAARRVRSCCRTTPRAC